MSVDLGGSSELIAKRGASATKCVVSILRGVKHPQVQHTPIDTNFCPEPLIMTASKSLEPVSIVATTPRVHPIFSTNRSAQVPSSTSLIPTRYTATGAARSHLGADPTSPKRQIPVIF